MILALALIASAGSPAMVAIPGGELRPLFPPPDGAATVPVAPFHLDRVPVTNAEFLAFVTAHPAWRRDRISPLFADASYLARWAAPDALGPDVRPAQPVTGVSWFGASAYCEARGARLPTEVEWEFAASATRDRADGRDDPAWAAEVLAWYSRPSGGDLADVGGPANFWGVSDLHGLVWEWVLDFNATLITGDARESGDADRLRFCGAGAATAEDARDYAGFMRAAFRSSLEARYTTRNLGFRCAADQGVSP